MKRKSTMKMLALAALLAGAPQLVNAQSTAGTASKEVYDFANFDDSKLLDLFYKAHKAGRRFPTADEIKAAGLSNELEFVRSHVRKRDIMSRDNRLIKDTYEKRDLFMNIPAGAGKTVGGYPSHEFASDNFSMWNYTNLFGAWNHGLFQAPGSWADAAHKNGTDMMSGIKFFDTTGGRGGHATGWVDFIKAKEGETYKYAEPLINLLQYLGLDGINYNWETSGYNDPTVVGFHQELYRIANERKFKNFHIAIYTSNSGLTDDDAPALFGSEGKKTTDLMLNYAGGKFTYSIGSSVQTAKRTLGTAEGLYAGVWIVSMDNRGWSRLNANGAKECGLCLWGEHAQSRFWSYNAGGDANELMSNYQALLERGFSGGNRNPANLPSLSEAGNNWEEANDQKPLSTFAGLAKWIPERSAIKGNLPFSTYFNLGAGMQYHYKGKKTHGSWYNMASQDVVPTYRWLVYTTNTTTVSTALQPEFSYKDAYTGGSCLQLTGKAPEASTDVILYQTDLQGTDGDIYANIAIKSGKATATNSNLYLLVHLKNSNEWKEYSVGDTQNASWVEHKVKLDGISSNTAIDKIGLRVKNVTNDYKMLVGKLELVDNYSVTPSNVKDLAVQVKEETKTSLSVKASWGVEHDEATTGLLFNDDANIDHFEVLYKNGETGKVAEVGRTTQWAAYVGNIDLPNTSDTPFIGVRAVGKDLKTYSPIVWQQVSRANQDQLPTKEVNPYIAPELDTDAEGYKTAQQVRYVEQVTTTGGTTNLTFNRTTPFGGTNYFDATVDGGTLTVEQGKEVTLTLKGYHAEDYKDKTHDDLRYCFGRGWIDLNGDKKFEPGNLENGGEELFTVGTLRQGVLANVNPGQTLKFTIPQDARKGETRMRIVFSDAWFKGALKPTGKFNKGCAIDFKVVITGNNKERAIPVDTRDQGEADQPENLTATSVTNYAVEASSVTLNNKQLNFANADKVWIFSADGTLVEALTRPTFYNVASLPQGVYLVKMQSNNVIRTQKITIK